VRTNVFLVVVVLSKGNELVSLHSVDFTIYRQIVGGLDSSFALSDKELEVFDSNSDV